MPSIADFELPPRAPKVKCRKCRDCGSFDIVEEEEEKEAGNEGGDEIVKKKEVLKSLMEKMKLKKKEK